MLKASFLHKGGLLGILRILGYGRCKCSGRVPLYFFISVPVLPDPHINKQPAEGMAGVFQKFLKKSLRFGD